MKILFAGTPEIAVPALEAVAAGGHDVEVLTNPDAPAGRSGHPLPPPVKLRALALGLPVHQPAKLDGQARGLLEGRFELLISFAYGRIFGPLFLALFSRGGINVHPSLLPRWRGPAPLAAAILARDAETGITIQRLALKMDSGDILAQTVRSLDGTETTGGLEQWAALDAVPPLLDTLERIEAGKLSPRPQVEELATSCALTTKEDGLIDWTLPAVEVDARIRAMDPWPGAFTDWDGQRLALKQSSVVTSASGSGIPGTVVAVDKSKGILIQTGDGLVAVRELQRPARKSLDFRSFLNGNPALVGSRLGELP